MVDYYMLVSRNASRRIYGILEAVRRAAKEMGKGTHIYSLSKDDELLELLEVVSK